MQPSLLGNGHDGRDPRRPFRHLILPSLMHSIFCIDFLPSRISNSNISATWVKINMHARDCGFLTVPHTYRDNCTTQKVPFKFFWFWRLPLFLVSSLNFQVPRFDWDSFSLCTLSILSCIVLCPSTQCSGKPTRKHHKQMKFKCSKLLLISKINHD